MAESNTEDVYDITDPNAVPGMHCDNYSEDKYVPTVTHPDKVESETSGDTWNFPTTTSEDERNEADEAGKETVELDGDNTCVANLETSNKERRKNNRLQSGAKPDKYSNAHRFPGGHGKANENRSKPTTDQNITPIQTDQKGSQERSSEDSRQPNNRRNEGGPRGCVYKETDEYVFFWRQESPFSQWHRAKFTIDGIEYNCAEQYMMYQKAKTAKNETLMEVIIKESEPEVQKRYGRQIPELDHTHWERVREDVVKKGNMAKNPSLKDVLCNTYPKKLVEASPHDQVWGIGLDANDPDALNIEKWRGLNLLGKILTEVRDEILKEIGFL